MFISRDRYEALFKRSCEFEAHNKAQEELIDYLEKTIDELKETIKLQEQKVDREQVRGDRAIDTLLSAVAKVEPVSPMVPMRGEEDPFAEDPKEVQRLVDMITKGNIREAFFGAPELTPEAQEEPSDEATK